MDVLSIVNLAYFCWTDPPCKTSARDVNIEKRPPIYAMFMTVTCSKIVDILVLDSVSKLPIVRKSLGCFQNYAEKSSEKMIK